MARSNSPDSSSRFGNPPLRERVSSWRPGVIVAPVQSHSDYNYDQIEWLSLPYYLMLKAEALHLADRTSEALEAINEGEALAERFEQRIYFFGLHWLRGVFLATLGADEAQIEASYCEAIRIAREQKSIALEKRAEATYTEYRRRKASGPGGRVH
jgi:hypothetical protein